MLVLSNGKKVVPSLIEGMLTTSELIDQAVVVGESRPFLTALIIPKWPAVLGRLKRQVDSTVGIEGASQDSDLQAILEHEIAEALKTAAPWEQVKHFAVLPHPLTVASGELTVSLKLRREIVEQKYQHLLQAFYSS